MSSTLGGEAQIGCSRRRPTADLSATARKRDERHTHCIISTRERVQRDPPDDFIAEVGRADAYLIEVTR